MGACDIGDPVARVPEGVASRESQQVTIVGRWVVVAIDDEVAVPMARPITVAINADTIRAQSQCVPFPFLYKLRGTRILLGKINPGLVCARGLSRWEQEFEIGMYNADRVGRTADGELVFSGMAGTVTMRADTTGKAGASDRR